MNCPSQFKSLRFIKRSSFFWLPPFFWLPSLYKKLFFESTIDLKTYWCVNVLPFHYQFLLSSSSIQISNRNLFFSAMFIIFFAHIVAFGGDAKFKQ
jgi:hypothetical protein